MTLKTKRWCRGVLAAIIGGGSHAVAPTGAVTLIDSQNFNPVHQLFNFLILSGSTFIVSGAWEMFRYLSNNPLPDFDTAPPFPVTENKNNSTT